MILFIKYCIVFFPMLFFPFCLRDLPLKVWRVSHLLSHGKVMSFYSQFFLMMASYNMVCHFFVVVFKEKHHLLRKSWPHYQCRWFAAFKSHYTIVTLMRSFVQTCNFSACTQMNHAVSKDLRYENFQTECSTLSSK